MEKYIAALDQGTTSTRCLIFNGKGEILHTSQLEHRQIYPKPGWVEHDPGEIWEKTCQVIAHATQSVQKGQIAALGITNQRETVIAWNRKTGKFYGNALVWQDTRTEAHVQRLQGDGSAVRVQELTGLHPSAYFSGTKIQWMLQADETLNKDAHNGEAVFGTVDSYLCWQLSGGPGRGVIITDVTNASRTMLMNLHSLDWDDQLLEIFQVPRACLPEIRPSIPSEPYAFTTVDGPFGEKLPISGILGDQQAALFGQACFEKGESKNTYGTGAFLLMNTGTTAVPSRKGLLSTVAFQRGGDAAHYALEGSIAIAGQLVQWLRDNLGMIKKSDEVEDLAASVEDSGGVYYVPAFSGLYAPYWRSDARGVIAGLTSYAGAGHIARAVLEATGFQTLDIFTAMLEESGLEIAELKVDGGMTANNLLMQFQADILAVPVVRPAVSETTALGAAYAAGLSTGFWSGVDELRRQWKIQKRWQPKMESGERRHRLRYWHKAVERTLNWQEE